jgi:hypothetical protein
LIKKQIIGSILILFAILELVAFEAHRNSYQIFAYYIYDGITAEMFLFLFGGAVFLIMFGAGFLIWRKNLLIYSSIVWAVIAGIVGTWSFWTLTLAVDEIYGGIQGRGPSIVYYIIGSFQSQTAVSLAVLALCASREAKSQFLSVFIRLCLIFSWAVILVYIGYMIFWYPHSAGQCMRIFHILFDTMPISAVIALMLFILKEKKVLPIVLETMALAILAIGVYWGALKLILAFPYSQTFQYIFIISVIASDLIYLCIVGFWPKNIHVKIILGALLFGCSAAIATIYVVDYLLRDFHW